MRPQLNRLHLKEDKKEPINPPPPFKKLIRPCFGSETCNYLKTHLWGADVTKVEVSSLQPVKLFGVLTRVPRCRTVLSGLHQKTGQGQTLVLHCLSSDS